MLRSGRTYCDFRTLGGDQGIALVDEVAGVSVGTVRVSVDVIVGRTDAEGDQEKVIVRRPASHSMNVEASRVCFTRTCRSGSAPYRCNQSQDIRLMSSIAQQTQRSDWDFFSMRGE
jgi:hypothetical protein